MFPLGITWSIPDNGDTIEDTNGELVGTWSTGSAVAPTSTGGSAWVMGVGSRIKWLTPAIFRGRKVVGSTFMVPLDRTQFTSAGAIDDAGRATLQTAGNALIANANNNLFVWSRNHPDQSDGDSFEVSSCTVPDQVSWLRSRRL